MINTLPFMGDQAGCEPKSKKFIFCPHEVLSPPKLEWTWRMQRTTLCWSHKAIAWVVLRESWIKWPNKNRAGWYFSRLSIGDLHVIVSRTALPNLYTYMYLHCKICTFEMANYFFVVYWLNRTEIHSAITNKRYKTLLIWTKKWKKEHGT